MLTLLSKGVPTKLLKFFLLKIFLICHRCQDTGGQPWAGNISTNFRKISKRSKWDTLGLGRNWLMKKNRSEKSRDTVPLIFKFLGTLCLLQIVLFYRSLSSTAAKKQEQRNKDLECEEGKTQGLCQPVGTLCVLLLLPPAWLGHKEPNMRTPSPLPPPQGCVGQSGLCLIPISASNLRMKVTYLESDWLSEHLLVFQLFDIRSGCRDIDCQNLTGFGHFILEDCLAIWPAHLDRGGTEQGRSNTSGEVAVPARSEEELTTVVLAKPNSKQMLTVVYIIILTYLCYTHEALIFYGKRLYIL